MLQRLIGSVGHAASLSQIVLVLPLSLDIAGKECFLALSFLLSLYYIVSATTFLVFRNTRLSFLSNLFSLGQLVAIPSLLLVCFNLYSADYKTSAKVGGWIWTVLRHGPHWWERILTWSTPLFVLLEGFSTLLCIQSLGQLSRYVVQTHDESFSLIFLMASAAIYVASAWFLYESYGFAARETISATLIGVSLTTVVFLSAIAFAMRKGSPVETSLMMAYCVYNVYWLSSEKVDPVSFFSSFKSAAVPPLPPMLLQSATALIGFISSTFGASLDFVFACSSSLPLSVFVNLLYRVIVLYAALRIVVAIKRANSGFEENTPLREEEPMVRAMTVIVSYSRAILISVYTHLLLVNDQGHQEFWRWVNTFVALAMWAVEILIGREDSEAESLITGLRLKSD